MLDPVEQAASELGAAVTGCASGGYTANNKTLTLTLANNVPVVLAAPSTKISVNGNICMNAGVALTTTTVAKIVLDATGTAGDNNKVVIDMLPGSFGSIFSTTGGVTLNLGAGADAVMFRGTKSADNYKLGKATDYYAELSGDKVADVKIVRTGGTLTLSASTGEGGDTFSASPAVAEVTSFAGSPVTIAALDLPITVYGGGGNDSLRGGGVADILYGGDGDDTFLMGAAADGGDVYSGDAGTDTVDYSGRNAGVVVDIGPSGATAQGTVDLHAGVFPTMTGLTLELKIDGGAPVAIDVGSVTDIPSLISTINTDLGVTATARTFRGKLLITSATAGAGGKVEVTSNTDCTAELGLTVQIYDWADADDGLVGEGDDVRFSTENITGSAYGDTLIGSSVKNTIKGGVGDDIICGGYNTTFASAAVADVLNGETGDDTFLVPAQNNYATLSGAAGSDTVSFAYRPEDITASDNGTADDGIAAEHVNVGTDIENLTGGDGDDTLTGNTDANTLKGGLGDDVLSGAAGDDTLIGGPGDDTLNGGAGVDVGDYTAAPALVSISLCVDALHLSGKTGLVCPAADDDDGEGGSAHTDQVVNVEWIKGSAYDDVVTCSTDDCLLEGNDGIDTLTGGAGNDQIFGGNQDDVLTGGAGDDYIDGNAGDDTIDGDLGDGDICISDATDVAPAVNCEI